MFKKFLICVIYSLICITALPAGRCLYAQGTETLTIATYYPSPYGVYKVLRLYPTGDFAPGTDCSAEGEGAMTYYKDPLNPANSLFLLCTGIPLTWQSIAETTGVILKNEFTVPGAYTFKVPPGVSAINVMLQGGGGGGGGSVGLGGGGGGGAGGYAAGILSVIPGTIYPVVVGGGGVEGEGSVNGSAGGPSSFAGLIITGGGVGGDHGGAGGLGGLGGVGSGGDVNLAGGNGSNASGPMGADGGYPAVASVYGGGGDGNPGGVNNGKGGSVIVEW